MKTMTGPILCCALALTCGVAVADDAADPEAAAIEMVVSDYLEGWFASDPARMAKAFHPNLAKYNIRRVGKTETEYLGRMTAEELVAMAHHNSEWVKDKKLHEIKILYRDDRLAVVHAVSDGFYDLCNLAKINDEWKIVQVLWDRNDLGTK